MQHVTIQIDYSRCTRLLKFEGDKNIIHTLHLAVIENSERPGFRDFQKFIIWNLKFESFVNFRKIVFF